MKKLRISVDGKQYDVEVEILEDDEDRVLPSYYYQNFPNSPVSAAPVAQPQANPAAQAPAARPKATPKPQTAGDNTLTSPINGVVLEIPAKVGQAVKENDVVIILEAMKMKTNISSPVDGEIASIEVNMGDRVESGQVLITYK